MKSKMIPWSSIAVLVCCMALPAMAAQETESQEPAPNPNGPGYHTRHDTAERWRKLDKDGDGIPYRTVPGNRNPMSSYFTRGTGHDENARYTEDSGIFQKNMERLKKKFDGARELVPAPKLRTTKGATIFLLRSPATKVTVFQCPCGT